MKFRSGPYYGFREGSLRSHTARIVSVLKPQSFTEQVSQGSRPSIGINKTSNVLEYFTGRVYALRLPTLRLYGGEMKIEKVTNDCDKSNASTWPPQGSSSL